jgi:hypothetical protein
MNTPLKIPFLTLLFIALIYTSSFAATLTGKVVRVLDGDTIEVLVDKEPIRIRLADIDCPEKGQPFGNAAKKYVLSPRTIPLLLKQRIMLLLSCHLKNIGKTKLRC